MATLSLSEEEQCCSTPEPLENSDQPGQGLSGIDAVCQSCLLLTEMFADLVAVRS